LDCNFFDIEKREPMNIPNPGSLRYDLENISGTMPKQKSIRINCLSGDSVKVINFTNFTAIKRMKQVPNRIPKLFSISRIKL
jgi:hypothetical protein